MDSSKNRRFRKGAGPLSKLDGFPGEPVDENIFPDKVAYLQRIVQFHENVREYNHSLLAIKDSFTRDVASIAWKRYYDYYRNDLNAHFLFEEEVLFRPMIAFSMPDSDNPDNEALGHQMASLVNSYLVIHDEIRKEAAGIFAWFRENKDHVSHKSMSDIFVRLKKLSAKATGHAAHENRHLFPLLRGHPQLAFLIGKAFMAHAGAYKERYRNKDTTRPLSMDGE